jgi:cytochrome c oxidase subunit 2
MAGRSVPARQRRSDWIWVLGVWIRLTGLGWWWTVATDFMPLPASEEAEEIDSAIEILTLVSVPVIALVLALLLVSVIRHRGERSETGDGPPTHGGRAVPWAWFGITAVLAAAVFVNPGYTGLRWLAARPAPELTFQVEGVQWRWGVTYPDGTSVEEPSELVLPVDTAIRFELTSADVIHSFWVPGFRMKQDVVPGRTTVVDVTPTTLGSFEDDPSLRLQCAELCGTGHPRMRLPVRVVERSAFDAYVAELAAGGSPSDEAMDASMEDNATMSEGANDG